MKKHIQMLFFKFVEKNFEAELNRINGESFLDRSKKSSEKKPIYIGHLMKEKQGKKPGQQNPQPQQKSWGSQPQQPQKPGQPKKQEPKRK